MRIGIDVQPLQTGTRYAGVGCYLRNLLQHLCFVDTENEYVLLLNNSDYLEEVNSPSSLWKKYYVNRKHRLGRFWWCWDTLYLPIVFTQKKIDIYHYNSLSEAEKMAPPFPFGNHRVVATVHDLIPVKFPEQCSEYFSHSLGKFDYSAKLRRLKHADAIITVSECSKHDIVELLEYPAERVFVAYNGVAEIFKQPPEPDRLHRFMAHYALPESCILYLGGYYTERKNVNRLLDAYKLLLHSDLAPQPSLVLAGLANPVQQQAMFSLIAEKELSHSIVILPYIPDEELPLLYHSASVFVYPSIYEGFGLPVAEAMACGTVVATSNRSSLPEVGGDACVYFDPYNINSMAEMMYKGLTDNSLREILSKAGPKRAERFTWEQTVQTMLSVYKQVYQG